MSASALANRLAFDHIVPTVALASVQFARKGARSGSSRRRNGGPPPHPRLSGRQLSKQPPFLFTELSVGVGVVGSPFPVAPGEDQRVELVLDPAQVSDVLTISNHEPEVGVRGDME